MLRFLAAAALAASVGTAFGQTVEFRIVERTGRVRRDGTEYSQAVGEGVFTPLGQGSIDFVTFVKTLRGGGYAGWWVLEQDVRLGEPWPEQDPAQNAKASLDYLSTLVA